MSAFIAKPEHGIAWITGASSGIGCYLAQGLAQKGWTVAATARSRKALDVLAGRSAGQKGQIVAKPCDVADASALKELIQELESEYGAIALAVLNAGVYLPVKIDKLQIDDFDKTLAVNVSGVSNGLIPLIEHMRQKGRGQIAITSSVAGYGGLPTSAAYGASKAALTNMAESLKFDLDKLNIHLQIVHPGFVDTSATKSNPFPMPFLMEPEKAASSFIKGLNKPGFEITFPRRFTYLLKLLNLLPYPLYFWLVNRLTGWNKRPAGQ